MKRNIPMGALTTLVLNVVMIILLLIIHPAMFQIENLSNFIGGSIPLLFIALGQTIVILTSGVDLSVGSMLSLINVVAATTLMHYGFLGILICLAVGAAAGLITGAIVAFGKIQPIITTLAMSSAWAGLALFVMPQPGGSVPNWYSVWTEGFIGPIPMNVVLLAILMTITLILVYRTRFGGYVLSLGTSEQGVVFSGINPKRIKLIVYSASGLMTALGALFLTGITGSGDPNIGPSYTLNSIAAVVVGGTSLLGGQGGIWRTVNGVLLLQLIIQVIFFLGVSSFYQEIVEGLLLILALGLNKWSAVQGTRKRGAQSAA